MRETVTAQETDEFLAILKTHELLVQLRREYEKLKAEEATLQAVKKNLQAEVQRLESVMGGQIQRLLPYDGGPIDLL